MTESAHGSASVSKFTRETGHDQSEITGHEIFEMTGHATETTRHDGLKYAPGRFPGIARTCQVLAVSSQNLKLL